MNDQGIPWCVGACDSNKLPDCNHSHFTENAVSRRCARMLLTGLVQGVGFRSHIARLAQQLALSGWVANTMQGVTIEIEGQLQSVERFLTVFDQHLPALARIDTVSSNVIQTQNPAGFQIRVSCDNTATSALITPDAATCSQCLSSIADKNNRRYQYPFTCCTECGPRYSVVQALPYDRVNTTMPSFTQCTACQAEYDSPEDRRYHAQANACPECGPQLSLVNSQSHVLSKGHEALNFACCGSLAQEFACQ